MIRSILLGATTLLLLTSLTSPACAVLVFSLADTDDVALSHSSSSPAASPPMAGSVPLGNGTFSWGSLATDSGGNTATFAGGAFSSADWGGLGTFTSLSIDVSNYDIVDISADFSGQFNTASEFSEFFYTLDGGSQVVFGEGVEDTTYSDEEVGVLGLDVSAVSSLTVGFSYDHNGSSDSFSVGSLTVAAIPEPTGFLFGSLIASVFGFAAVKRKRRGAIVAGTDA